MSGSCWWWPRPPRWGCRVPSKELGPGFRKAPSAAAKPGGSAGLAAGRNQEMTSALLRVTGRRLACLSRLALLLWSKQPPTQNASRPGHLLLLGKCPRLEFGFPGTSLQCEAAHVASGGTRAAGGFWLDQPAEYPVPPPHTLQAQQAFGSLGTVCGSAACLMGHQGSKRLGTSPVPARSKPDLE